MEIVSQLNLNNVMKGQDEKFQGMYNKIINDSATVMESNHFCRTKGDPKCVE
jgi:hypothetical protein